MANFALGLCQICSEPITLAEIREGVRWEETEKGWIYGYSWWSESEEENRVAHRRCWKELSEAERSFIRKEADVAPRSLGQKV